MAQLYPPIIPSTIPACYGTSIDVPFTMNRAVGNDEVKKFFLHVKEIDGTDIDVYEANSNEIFFSNNIVTFTIPQDALQSGVFYKIQLAYGGLADNDNSIIPGYYSSIGIMKYTNEPNVSLVKCNTQETIAVQYAQLPSAQQTFDALVNQANALPDVYTIQYKNTDITEKISQYRLLFDENTFDYQQTSLLDNMIPTYITDWQYAKPANDKTNNIFLYENDFAPKSNNLVGVKCEIITVNGLHYYSPTYLFSNQDNGSYWLSTKLHYLAQQKPDLGAVEIFLHARKDQAAKASRNLLIFRWDQNHASGWEKLVSIALPEAINNGDVKLLYTDYSIEQGVSYLYSIQETYLENNQRQYSHRSLVQNKDFKIPNNGIKQQIDTYPLFIDFESIFLSDQDRQICLRFNEEVSSLKSNIVENKVTTLGSKYPFITRNSDINYLEIPLSCLVSYNMDNFNTFIHPTLINKPWLSEILIPTYITQAEFEANPTLYYRVKTVMPTQNNGNKRITHSPTFTLLESWDDTQSVNGQQQVYQIHTGFDHSHAGTTQLTATNIKLEKIFRQELVDWLNNGQPKLLRTPTEGNHIVQITGVSLSPNKTVSRMIYTLSCSAVEIDDCTVANLKKYQFLNHSIVADQSQYAARKTTPHNLNSIGG